MPPGIPSPEVIDRGERHCYPVQPPFRVSSFCLPLSLGYVQTVTSCSSGPIYALAPQNPTPPLLRVFENWVKHNGSGFGPRVLCCAQNTFLLTVVHVYGFSCNAWLGKRILVGICKKSRTGVPWSGRLSLKMLILGGQWGLTSILLIPSTFSGLI